MMPLRRREVALLSSLMGAAASMGIAQTVQAHGAQHHDHGASRVAGASSFKREMDQSMAAMMQAMHAPSYSGNPDVDFLAMMVPHHQGAVDMARLVLQHGKDPVTRQLAEEIIAGQTVEIDSMRRRLALLNKDVCTTEQEYPTLGGTRGP